MRGLVTTLTGLGTLFGLGLNSRTLAGPHLILAHSPAVRVANVTTCEPGTDLIRPLKPGRNIMRVTLRQLSLV